jgi:hypothetical protein
MKNKQVITEDANMRLAFLKKILILFFLSVNFISISAQRQYNSYKGLVMAGYQGWFNTPDDGANRGWHHYDGKQGFNPGSCSIDFWPDVSDYKILYKTPFSLQNGKSAYTFSSIDASTVDTHFKWMKDYGIDGVFMQRFINEIKNPRGKTHFNKVLKSAMLSAKKYGRAICIMYDLSGMLPGDEEFLLRDIDNLEMEYGLKMRGNAPTYLFHNRKPLIAVWGIGFNDKRKYGLTEAATIIEGLKKRGYSVMTGVPTYWRELSDDAVADAKLHETIRKSDIILPWFVGRYNEKSYENFKTTIKNDMEWCKKNNVDYVPLCYPGFSWRNMRGLDSFYINRNSGSFLWKQFFSVIEYGAEMIYVAMFDEINEGTAIFKCANRNNVPNNGKVGFDGIEDHLPTDFYLWLTGEAGKMLRKQGTFSEEVPKPSVQFTTLQPNY